MESNATTSLSQEGAILAALKANNAPRAMLVSIGRNGQLVAQPVEQNQSVLNIETELVSHLNEQPCKTEFLVELLNYCDGRLAARREANKTGGFVIPKSGGWNIAHINAFTTQGRGV